MTRTIGLREQNRTLMERQMLIEPWRGGCVEVVGRLVGVQAQVASPPYFGLWCRMGSFAPGDLMGLRDAKVVVRAALLRSTLHWVRAEDFRWVRPVIQPALEKAWQGFFGARKAGIEVEPICAVAKDVLKQGPVSLNELSDRLVEEFPQWNKEAMEYGVRTHLPLVQVPPAGAWRGGTMAKYALMAVEAKRDEKRLVRRYLEAFGPASARDVAAWAGYTGIAKVVEGMRGELVEYVDEQGRTLFDVPEGRIVDGKRPVPVRFVAELDNLVLGHADRTRVLPEVYRKRVLLTAGRVMATVLIDGFVGGIWKIEKEKKTVRIRVELFAEPAAKVRKQVAAEGERLAAFCDASEVAIQ